jgi:hypothetical protein
MNRLRAMLSLFALSTLSVGSAMAASPRDAPEYVIVPPLETSEERHSRRVAETEAALGWLVGRFGIERPWVLAAPPPPASAPRTMMDCAAIGDGKGVRCVFLAVPSGAVPARGAGAGRQPPSLRPGGVSLAFRLIEYGLDPNALRVRQMKVDGGTAVLMEGRVSGDWLTTWGRCWNSTPECQIEQRIAVSADGEDLWITDFQNWEHPNRYALRRLTQEEVDAANWSVEGARPTFPTKPGRPR